MVVGVPRAGQLAVNVTAQMGLKLRVGHTFFSTVTRVHVWVLRNTFTHKSRQSTERTLLPSNIC